MTKNAPKPKAPTKPAAMPMKPMPPMKGGKPKGGKN